MVLCLMDRLTARVENFISRATELLVYLGSNEQMVTRGGMYNKTLPFVLLCCGGY